MNATPSQFAAHERLLHRLHALIVAGEGDSEAADALRDEMSATWHLLTDEQRAALRELSAQLYEAGA